MKSLKLDNQHENRVDSRKLLNYVLSGIFELGIIGVIFLVVFAVCFMVARFLY